MIHVQTQRRAQRNARHTDAIVSAGAQNARTSPIFYDASKHRRLWVRVLMLAALLATAFVLASFIASVQTPPALPAMRLPKLSLVRPSASDGLAKATDQRQTRRQRAPLVSPAQTK